MMKMFVLGAVLASLFIFIRPEARADGSIEEVRVQLASRTPQGQLIVRMEKTTPRSESSENSKSKPQNLLYWGDPKAGLSQLFQITSYEEMPRGNMVHLFVSFRIRNGAKGQKARFYYGNDTLFGLHTNAIRCPSSTISLTPLKKDEVQALEARIRSGEILLKPLPRLYIPAKVLKSEEPQLYLYFDLPLVKGSADKPDTQQRIFIGPKNRLEQAQISNLMVYWRGSYLTLNKSLLYFSPQAPEKEPTTLTIGSQKLILTSVTNEEEIRSLNLGLAESTIIGRGAKLETPCD